MAMQSVAPFPWPAVHTTASAGISTGGMTALTGAGNYTAIICQAQVAMSISQIEFAIGTFTSTGTCTVGLETVNGSGLPSGSAYGGSTVSATSGNITTVGQWLVTALGGAGTTVVGDFFAIVIRWVSGSFAVARVTNASTPFSGAMPYVVQNGTPSSMGSFHMMVAAGDGTNYLDIPSIIPCVTVTSTGFNNVASPNEIALRFQLPFKARLLGGGFYQNGAGGNYMLNLYDTGTTVLTGTAQPGVNQSGSGNMGYTSTFLASPQLITPNTTYRLAMTPTSATNVSRTTYNLNSAALLPAMPGRAQCYYSTRNGGAWTDDTTKVPLAYLILDQLSNDAGGGGGPGIICGDASHYLRAENPLILGSIGAAMLAERNPSVSRRMLFGMRDIARRMRGAS